VEVPEAMPRAYVLLDIEVTDAEAYRAYRDTAERTVLAHGGRYVVRGGAHEVLEGEWRPRRLVVLEFPSMDAARAWYRSPEYQEASAVRQKASRGSFVLVEGVA
jgi:uncharacterized protein (DUF1330 family)